MGEMSREKTPPRDVKAELIAAGVRADVASMYADQYRDYVEAQDNITRNGAVVQNPRTGAPITNPYLKVRDDALKGIQKLNCRKAEFLWAIGR